MPKKVLEKHISGVNCPGRERSPKSKKNFTQNKILLCTDEGLTPYLNQRTYSQRKIIKYYSGARIGPYDRPYKMLLLACAASCSTGTIL